MKTLLFPLGAPLPPAGPDRLDNRARHAALELALADKRAVVAAGWDPDKVKKKGKLTTEERLSALLDPGTAPLRVGTLVNWGRSFPGSKRLAPGAGVLTCFGRVQDRWCVIIANDNTVASGAWWPLTPEKIQRAQHMALALRLPVIYLVDCSGLYLPEQSRSFPGRTGAGHIFTMNARLSAAGVPQIAGVFGDCIAGGGYMPIISDRVYMTEGAYMVIAGAALIKGAKAQHLTSLDIGGPEVHVHQSATADVRVPDDRTALARIREEIARLPSSGADFYRHLAEPEPPLYAPAELPELLPTDHREVYDVRQVLARLVDGSLFHEVLGHTGPEVLTGVARVNGLWMGFAANALEPHRHPSGVGSRPGGILYREGIARLSAFARACDDDGIPLVWLVDVAGFDIGVEAEALGLLGYGSSLIYANATRNAPIFTILLRKASGAGYYAMAGHPYEPVLQLATPVSRLSVMEGRTLAIATWRTKLDENFEVASPDPAEREAVLRGMDETAGRIESDMDPVAAASRMDTDEIVTLGELRGWLEALAEMSYQAIGYRRVKNPRIWGIHDLAVLTAGRALEPEAAGPPEPEPEDENALAEGLVPVRAPMEGTFWSRARPGSPPFAVPGAPIAPEATLALIEVMKTFTPIRASQAGILAHWTARDGQGVRPGQVLGWLKPA